MEEFESLREARMRTRDWREDYNKERPHSSLGYMTPAEFAGACAASGQATAAQSYYPELFFITRGTEITGRSWVLVVLCSKSVMTPCLKSTCCHRSDATSLGRAPVKKMNVPCCHRWLPIDP
jgi:hypothetical protein